MYAGLDVSRDHILEVACIITDKELNLVAEVRMYCTFILCCSTLVGIKIKGMQG